MSILLMPARRRLLALLEGTLGQYVELESDNMTMGLWHGDVELHNLTVKRDALYSAMGVIVNKGHVGKITAKVPWAHLGHKPVQIMIDEVELELAQGTAAEARPVRSDVGVKVKGGDDDAAAGSRWSDKSGKQWFVGRGKRGFVPVVRHPVRRHTAHATRHGVGGGGSGGVGSERVRGTDKGKGSGNRSSSAGASGPAGICKSFLAGKCNYGDKCKYQHGQKAIRAMERALAAFRDNPPDKGDGANKSATAPPVVASVQEAPPNASSSSDVSWSSRTPAANV